MIVYNIEGYKITKAKNIDKNKEQIILLENSYDNITNYSQFEIHTHYIVIAIVAPILNFKEIKIYITSSHIVLKSNSNFCLNAINKIMEKYNFNMTRGKFIFKLLALLIEYDWDALSLTEKELLAIENKILNNIKINLNDIPKNKITRYYKYYNQLLDIVESLKSTDKLFTSQYENKIIGLLISRISRLKAETAYLRDYVFQLQLMYQTQIEVKQNEIMQTLTIVTTIVLPLSLIAAWYGMNFKNVPETTWDYGYYYVIALSIVIVIISLVVFKKKGYI